jgi:hypothetical protein
LTYVEQRRTPVWQILLAVGLGVWTVAVTLLAQVALYLIDTVATFTRGEPVADSTQVAVGVVAAALVLAPAALLATLPLAGSIRAFALALAWAGAASALLAAARLAPWPYHELYLLGLSSAAVLASILQLWSTAKQNKVGHSLAPQLQDRRGVGGAGWAGWAAVCGGLLMLVPWAWVGALGGFVETALAGAAAAAIGWLAAVTTAPILRLVLPLRPVSYVAADTPERSAHKGAGRGVGAGAASGAAGAGVGNAASAGAASGGRGVGAGAGSGAAGAGRVFAVGLGTGVALVPLAGATGETGVALAELGVLPVLGFAVAVLRRGTGTLVALAAAGPLAFVDPEETSLVLGTSDVAFWTLVAAASAFLIAVLLAVGYALAARSRRRSNADAVPPPATSASPDAAGTSADAAADASSAAADAAGAAADAADASASTAVDAAGASADAASDAADARATATPTPATPTPGAPTSGGSGAGRIRRSVAGVLALVLALGVVGIHAGLGQPGLHGDHLFVVLRQQADLTGLDTIPDRAERLRQSYRRLVEHAERTQADLRSDLRRYRIGFRPYYLVNGLEVYAGPALRSWLSRRSDVDSVLTNPVLRPLPAEPSPLQGRPEPPDGPLWNIRMVRADQAWEAANARGAGIVIGASDSGVDGTHPALESAFRGGDDSWYDPWNATTRPTDNNGHGTHTLGTALGRGGIGVAPDASWIGCVNLDRNLGSPSHYLDCLQFMLAPFPPTGDPLRDGRPERAAHVLTNSWGCPKLEGCERGVLHPAIAALTAAGIFVVAAAGNSGESGCGSITDEPAIDPEAITVGAVSAAGAVPSFSSRGPVPGAAKPDVVAPGTQIMSAVPGGGYRAERGTSMATPHVAGVVALMWSANPRLIGNVTRTAEILRSTARTAPLVASPDDCGDPRNIRGAGLVDALAAVTAARAIGP